VAGRFKDVVKELVRETDEVRAKRDKAASRTGTRRVINVEDRKNSTIITPTLNKTQESNQVFVNNYRVMGKLGSGSYGTVHLVESVPSGTKYAMKIVSKSKLRKKKLGQSDEQLLREVGSGPVVV
jgi:serine/threonine protein kinase